MMIGESFYFSILEKFTIFFFLFHFVCPIIIPFSVWLFFIGGRCQSDDGRKRDDDE